MLLRPGRHLLLDETIAKVSEQKTAFFSFPFYAYYGQDYSCSCSKEAWISMSTYASGAVNHHYCALDDVPLSPSCLRSTSNKPSSQRSLL